jgi:hypothetical protein
MDAIKNHTDELLNTDVINHTIITDIFSRSGWTHKEYVNRVNIHQILRDEIANFKRKMKKLQPQIEDQLAKDGMSRVDIKKLLKGVV